jgi:hypothetical protein
MPPISITIERSELDAMKELQRKNHRKWPAAFNTNSECQIWPFVRYGKTPYNEREHIQGKLAIIDRIAETYLSERPEGGRFFISDDGVFYSEECSEPNQFIEFIFSP